MTNMDSLVDIETVEWINGKRYKVSPLHPKHGRVFKKVFNLLAIYLEDKNCELFPYGTNLCLFNPESTILIDDLK